MTQVQQTAACCLRICCLSNAAAVVILPQFMENWCYDRKTLYSFAKHYESGEPLPEELYQRLLAARTYRWVPCRWPCR